MKSGAVILLAILLGVFLAVGQCGSGSAEEKDDDSHSSSSASSVECQSARRPSAATWRRTR